MARRKRATATRRRRRSKILRSVRRVGGGTVTRQAWRRAGFRRNPRRLRRNPPILREVTDLGIETLAALGGAAVGRQVANLIPIQDTGTGPPVIDWAKNALIAIGIRAVAPRLRVPKHLADAAALGAMLGPTKNLVTALVPQASQFLGDGVTMLPATFPGQRMLSAYSRNGLEDYAEEEADIIVDDGLGAYAPSF